MQMMLMGLWLRYSNMSSSLAAIRLPSLIATLIILISAGGHHGAMGKRETCSSVQVYSVMNGRRLVTMDMSTRGTTKLTLSRGNIMALEYDSASNELYGLRSTSGNNNKKYKAVKIDPDNGDVNVIGRNIKREDTGKLVTKLAGLTANEDGSVFYAHSNDDEVLYSIHPKRGTATEVVGTGGGMIRGAVVDLAYYDGHVWAITTSSTLYKLAPSSGKVKEERPLVDSPGRMDAIFFSDASTKDAGVLYGIIAGNNNNGASIHQIVKTSGRVLQRVLVQSNIAQPLVGGALRCSTTSTTPPPPPQTCTGLGSPSSFQPKVTVVEGLPARRGFFSGLSLPGGSPWCGGRSTYWEVGHQKREESPWCLTGGDAAETNAWTQPLVAVMDITDELNAADPAHPENVGQGAIDRHSCAPVDVNEDGMPDIVCVIGANGGRGKGFAELYLTQGDGSIQKVLEHGLQKHPTVRGRLVVAVRGAANGGEQLVFEGSNGIPRDDGMPNTHFMYKTVPRPPYFVQVKGPWEDYIDAPCAKAADVNGDGVEDLVLCNTKGSAVIFQQQRSGGWSRVRLPSNDLMDRWRNLRIGDVTRDGVDDLVAVIEVKEDESSILVVFQGLASRAAPYFNFDAPYYRAELKYAAPDVELLDANGDGRRDIYVVQNDELNENQYCALQNVRGLWDGATQPPDDWVPPKDRAPDVLFVNTAAHAECKDSKFVPVQMEHSVPGCGFHAQRFGTDRTLSLAHGEPNRPGFNVLLQWD